MNVNSKIYMLMSFIMLSGCSPKSFPIVAPEPITILQINTREIPYAFPLSYYHNRVCVFNTDIVYDTDDVYIAPVPFDSSSYRNRLLEYSTSNDVNPEKLLIKGLMIVDSIIEGINVYKLIVDYESEKYYGYSLYTNNVTKRSKRMDVGKAYYMEILPYYYQDPDNYNNCGLYYDGYVIEDHTLPIYKWKYVCTTKWISGIKYTPETKKTR